MSVATFEELVGEVAGGKGCSDTSRLLNAANKRAALRKPEAKLQRFEPTKRGQYVRQGDVLIVFVAGLAGAKAALPTNVELIEAVAQLATGDTKGSRHVLDSLDGVKMYDYDGEKRSATPLEGPWMLLDEQRVVGHPEHGAWELPPGLHRVRYERTAAERIEAVQD